MKKHKQLVLKISEIILDNAIQPRSRINYAVVEKYAEAMQMGAQFPPVIAFYDGSKYWLADGFHRIQAKQAIGKHKILASVIFGARREAILYSVGANRTHGLSLCNIDTHKFFDKILYDDERNILISSNKTQNRQRSRRYQKGIAKYIKPLLNTS